MSDHEQKPLPPHQEEKEREEEKEEEQRDEDKPKKESSKKKRKRLLDRIARSRKRRGSLQVRIQKHIGKTGE
ncbi:MAG: hypothetical protein HYT29_02410 [Parcubacteria group bacterium]|nr:hypothetical protein [Parcubacteria group bacterium]